MEKKYYDTLDETIYTDKLTNGLRVFLLPKAEMSKTYAIFSTNYGSIDREFVPIGKTETETVPDGVAHFLEHKMFEKEDKDVFEDFGKQGASANAFTSFTQTAYLFSATSHIEKNIETLLDFVQEPYFSDKSVEKEKGIIGQEINMYNDQPDWQAFMGTLRALYQNNPVRIDIAGTVESISHITKEDLYTCYNTFYHPENMQLFITGKIDPEKIMSLIHRNQDQKQFESVDNITRNYPDEPIDVAMPENKIIMPVSTPKCTVGIKVIPDKDPSVFLKQDILQDLIMSYYFSKGGPLYQELYNADLIDSSFYYETNLDRSIGYVLIGSNTEKPEQFAAKVKELLHATTKEKWNDEQLSLMKKRYIGELLRGMNSLEYIANKYIHYQTFGIDFFEIVPIVQALTVDDMNDYVTKWVTENRIAVCKIMSE